MLLCCTRVHSYRIDDITKGRHRRTADFSLLLGLKTAKKKRKEKDTEIDLMSRNTNAVEVGRLAPVVLQKQVRKQDGSSESKK
jgi:hypothetical protein